MRVQLDDDALFGGDLEDVLQLQLGSLPLEQKAARGMRQDADVLFRSARTTGWVISSSFIVKLVWIDAMTKSSRARTLLGVVEGSVGKNVDLRPLEDPELLRLRVPPSISACWRLRSSSERPFA